MGMKNRILDGKLMRKLTDKYIVSHCPLFNCECAISCRFFTFEEEMNPYAPSNWVYACCGFEDYSKRGKVLIGRGYSIEDVLKNQKV